MTHRVDAVREALRPEAEAEPIRCEICATKTRKGKPFCLAHLREMPYVAALVRELEREGYRSLAG